MKINKCVSNVISGVKRALCICFKDERVVILFMGYHGGCVCLETQKFGEFLFHFQVNF